MKRTIRLAALTAAATSSKTAGAAGAGTSVLVAAGIGLDLWPFVIGAIGATVVIAAQQPRTRQLTWIHSVVSVFLGGVGGPFASSIASLFLTKYLDLPSVDNQLTQLMCAGILSAGWPWFGPFVWDQIKKRGDAAGAKNAN